MIVESEVEVLKSVVNKLDSSLEKISEVSNSIGKLLAVHDERIGQLEKTSERRIDDIKEVNNKITTQTKEIVEKIDKLEKTLEREIKETTEELRGQHTEIKDNIDDRLDKLDTRINILENWRWYILGAAAAGGFVLNHLNDLLKLIK